MYFLTVVGTYSITPDLGFTSKVVIYALSWLSVVSNYEEKFVANIADGFIKSIELCLF